MVKTSLLSLVTRLYLYSFLQSTEKKYSMNRGYCIMSYAYDTFMVSIVIIRRERLLSRFTMNAHGITVEYLTVRYLWRRSSLDPDAVPI